MTHGSSSRAADRASADGLVEAILVGAGGAVGAVARALVGATVAARGGPDWSATWLVNLAGTFALGLLVGAFELHGPRPRVRAFLAIGFLGAFTTFSTLVGDARTFSAQATAARVGAAIGAFDLIVSLALGLAAFRAGQSLIVRLGARRTAPERPASGRPRSLDAP